MSITVSITIEKSFNVSATPEEVFALLSNVPESVSHFPKVENLVDLGDNTFRWEMEKIGVGDYFIQTVYASKYESDEDEGKVTWTPVKGEGNGLVSGHWEIKANHYDGTDIDFYTKGELTLPFPFFTKMILGPLVENEFKGLVDKYIKNLTKTLDKDSE